MRIYWTLKSIPELSNLQVQERRKRWKRVYKSCFRHWETWAGLTLGGLLAGLGSYFYTFPGSFIGGFIGGSIYFQIVVYVALKYYRNLLRGDYFDLESPRV
ncbi:hypothetical protein [Atlantibacter hermannii]|uniref:hypothetical protein n=1 Tax=Atlantibacter hermannii TaxID=565 RepID=UPI0028A9B136|nr:hypothetical protein [Atlantibacter hermannii]